MAEANLNCPHCEDVITVDAAQLGTTIPCPACEQPIKLPAPPPEPVAVKEATFAPAPTPAPAQATAPAEPHEETEIFDISPKLLGYIGRIVWGIIWIAAGIAAMDYLSGLKSLAEIKGLEKFASDLKQYELTPNAPYFALILSAFGVLKLLRVFVESMFNRFRLTSERLFLRTGFIARHSEEIELFRVKDVSVRQGVLHRLVGAGNVTVLSSDDSTPYVILRGIPRPNEVKEQIRQGSRAARQREGMRAAEFIQS